MFLFDMDLERKANETRRSKLLLTLQIYKQFSNQQIKNAKKMSKTQAQTLDELQNISPPVSFLPLVLSIPPHSMRYLPLYHPPLKTHKTNGNY